jgi:hypothetical protein
MTPTHGLLGWFGHSLDEQGEICEQFEITRTLANGYGCQMYSWFLGLGEPTEIKVISETDLADPKKFRFYASLEEWHRAAEGRDPISRARQK